MTLSWEPVSDCDYAVYKVVDGKAELIQAVYDNKITLKETGSYFVAAVTKGNNAESLPSKTIDIVQVTK